MIKKEIQEALEAALQIVDEAYDFKGPNFHARVDFGSAEANENFRKAQEKLEEDMKKIFDDIFGARKEYQEASGQAKEQAKAKINKLEELLNRLKAKKAALMKAGKVGAGVAAAGAVAYGAKKLYDKNKLNRLAKRGR